MTNFECIKNMNIEQMAWFLATEATRLCKPVFDASGFGICDQVVFVSRLQWLKSEVDITNV